MDSHFTATGFVVDGDKTLLLWHRKGRMWLPPGGHILPGEHPVAAVLREIQEETSLRVGVISKNGRLPFAYPEQLTPPYTVLLENSFEEGPPHQHIDFIYFCRPMEDGNPSFLRAATPWLWLDRKALLRDGPLKAEGPSGLPPDDEDVMRSLTEDVRSLALEAIKFAKQC